MSFEVINLGTPPSGSDGDTVRSSNDKTNRNFATTQTALDAISTSLTSHADSIAANGIANTKNASDIATQKGRVDTLANAQAAAWSMSMTTRDVSGNATVTLGATEANVALLTLTGTLTGNVPVVVPAVPGMWTVRNLTTGNYTLTLKTPNSAGVPIPQGPIVEVWCDGTNVQQSGTGDVVLNGPGRRITGDFSNITTSSRVMFQTSIANTWSALGVIPNGTGAAAYLSLYNKSDPNNAGMGTLWASGSAVSLSSQKTGTGTVLPIWLDINGTIGFQLTTNANVIAGAGGISAAPAWLNTGAGGYGYYSENSSLASIALTRNSTTGYMELFQWVGSPIGSITNTTSTVAFNQTSDWRLKTITGPLAQPLAALRRLGVYSGCYTADLAASLAVGETPASLGFLIAHEVQAIFPSMVLGEKDATHEEPVLDAEGQPVVDPDTGAPVTKTVIDPQQLDYSKFVPWLIGGLQELADTVDAQAQTIAALAERLAAPEART